MKNKNPLGGSLTIIVITLLLVVVILVLGNQSFRATEKATFDEFNQRQLVLAKEATGGIELYFENLAGDMRALARLPEIQHLDETPTRREIQYMFHELEQWDVNDIGILDADGILKYNVTAPQIEGVDFSWRAYYQQVKEMTSSDTYVIEFIEFKGVDVGQKGVLVAVPMFENTADEDYPSPSGQFAGVVLCTLRLDTITQRFVAPIQSSERGHTLLIDDEYTVLWMPDQSLFGQNMLEASEEFPTFHQTVEEMSAGNFGVAEYAYYEFDESTGEHVRDREEEKLIAYAPIRLENELWSIGVWAPKENARQLIRSAYFQQLLVVGLSILIILFGSFYALAISYRTSKSLEKQVEIKAGEVMESHKRLLTVWDSLDAIIYVADMETYEVLFANEYSRNLWGDVVGKTCWQVLQAGQSGPCDFCTNDNLLTASDESSGVYTWENQNTVTGHWYQIQNQAIRWVDGRIVRLSIAMDITERKQMEEALRESREQYRQLVELFPDAIAVQNKDEIVFMNPAGAKLFGAENPEQLVGKSVWDFVPPENQGIVRERYRQMREKGIKAPPIEQRFVRLDGTSVDVEVTAIPFTHKGEPAIQAIFRDITERKQTEGTLEAVHTFQQSIIDGITRPIIVVGVDYLVKLMNRAAREIWVKDIDESRPLFCYQISHQRETPCDEAEFPCPLERVRESGQPVTVIHEHYLPNGEQQIVEIVTSPLWGADGSFQGIIKSTQDITEHKMAEEAMEQQAQVSVRSDDDLGQFAYKVTKSLQDFFAKLPPD
ncbi:MAG: PAS domain S-box protein [Chloroflexi bacterium]|nr:PAS domain S-box protein [Chloroflexota bacterium]